MLLLDTLITFWINKVSIYLIVMTQFISDSFNIICWKWNNQTNMVPSIKKFSMPFTLHMFSDNCFNLKKSVQKYGNWVNVNHEGVVLLWITGPAATFAFSAPP